MKGFEGDMDKKTTLENVVAITKNSIFGSVQNTYRSGELILAILQNLNQPLTATELQHDLVLQPGDDRHCLMPNR